MQGGGHLKKADAFSDGLYGLMVDAVAFALFAPFFNRTDQEINTGRDEGGHGNGGKDKEKILHDGILTFSAGASVPA